MIGLGLGLGLTRGWGAPALDLNFLNGTMPAAGLTFTRASTATYIGSDGLLKTAAVDEPRFDYDPVTLACKGLLIEGSRTNLLVRSSDIANASWAKFATTIGETVSSPYPTAATRIYETATTGEHGLTAPTTAYTAGQVYTFHTVLRSAGRTRARVLLPSAAFGEDKVGFYDLQSLSVVSTLGTGVTATISSVRDGCVMLTLTATATTSASATAGQLRFVDSGTNVNYAGSASLGMDFVYAQLEAGSFASSYIPTTTAAVTRAADTCLMTGTNFSRWFNPNEGTFAVEFSTITKGEAHAKILHANKGDGSQYGIWLAASTAYGPGFLWSYDGDASWMSAQFAAALGTGAVYRTALSYEVGALAASLNGGAIVDDANALAAISAIAGMQIGARDGGIERFDGHIRRIRYWPRRMDNSFVQQVAA